MCMKTSKHASFLVLFLLTAVLLWFSYLTHASAAFFGTMLSLSLLYFAPYALGISFDGQERARDAEREVELEKIRQLVAQQKESGKLLIRRDLELTRANEKLRALDQLKTDFITIATHQLRTPLTAIRWILNMLLRGDLGTITDEQRTYLMKAHESNNRMVALLSSMLSSDRLSSERLNINPTATAMLPDLADNVLTEIQPLADKRSVNLIFAERRDSYPRVNIDPQNMRAVLQNLLENAIKYTPPGGNVTLSILEHSDSLVFTVSDTGIGIPPDQQENVFKRFFRAQNAIRMETDGSGLGLFIVKSIVEKFKGDIAFESKENEGTTFRVVLPIAHGSDTSPSTV